MGSPGEMTQEELDRTFKKLCGERIHIACQSCMVETEILIEPDHVNEPLPTMHGNKLHRIDFCPICGSEVLEVL